MKKGEVDVIFPMYRSLYFGEEEGFLFSDTVLTSPLAAVTTENFFNESAKHTVAIYKGNIGINWYLSSNYPKWKVIECHSMQEREALMNGTLSMYANPVRKVTFVDFIRDNAVKFSAFVFGAFFLILLVILGFLKKGKESGTEKNIRLVKSPHCKADYH